MLHSQKSPPSTVLLLCYHKLCTCVYSYLIIHNLVTVIMDISYSLVYFVAFNIFLNKFISHIFSKCFHINRITVTTCDPFSAQINAVNIFAVMEYGYTAFHFLFSSLCLITVKISFLLSSKCKSLLNESATPSDAPPHLFMWLEFVFLAGSVGLPLKVMHALRHGHKLWSPLQNKDRNMSKNGSFMLTQVMNAC